MKCCKIIIVKTETSYETCMFEACEIRKMTSHVNNNFQKWVVSVINVQNNKRSELSHIKCNIDKCFRVEKTNQQGIYYTFDTK